MKKIRYFVTGHGLGHASRSCQIINTLRNRHPDIAVEVVSDAPGWFFKGFLDPSVPVANRRLDCGVLQKDSLLLDMKGTLALWRDFLQTRPTLVAAEAESLHRSGVTLVAADIPPAAFSAAAAAGLPSVGIANFGWDWIFRDFSRQVPGFAGVAEMLEADYRNATELLRLPFHGPFPAFSMTEDIPLVARRASRPSAEVRRLLEIPEGVRVGLISFGGFGLGDFDFVSLGKITGWIFLTEAGLEGQAANLRVIPPGTLPYPDLVGAADAVVTKPGYGIVSEAIVNKTAVLYTSRGEFPEQPLLIDALERYTRALPIENAPLRQGEWGEPLEALLTLPDPAETLAANGDEVAADRLAEMAG